MGYAQTAAVGIVLLARSLVRTELAGRPCTPKFDLQVCLFLGVSAFLSMSTDDRPCSFSKGLLPFHVCLGFGVFSFPVDVNG